MHAYLVCKHSIIRHEGLESPQVLASMSSFIPSTTDLEGWLYLSILNCPLAQFPDSLPDEEHLEVYNTSLLLLLPKEQIHTGVCCVAVEASGEAVICHLCCDFSGLGTQDFTPLHTSVTYHSDLVKL